VLAERVARAQRLFYEAYRIEKDEIGTSTTRSSSCGCANAGWSCEAS
jgi:hypothetical protein